MRPVPPPPDLTCELVELTPQIAQRWLTEAPYLYQRTANADHVELLAAEIASGRFREGTPIEFCAVGERDYPSMVSTC